jgi:hypothetical protein
MNKQKAVGLNQKPWLYPLHRFFHTSYNHITSTGGDNNHEYYHYRKLGDKRIQPWASRQTGQQVEAVSQ